MDETCIRRTITLSVCSSLAEQGEYYVPTAASARHVHLSRKDIDMLFGAGYELTQFKALSQPGQYASNEEVAYQRLKRRTEECAGLRAAESRYTS